ncbi:hypothetical protein [Halosimplex sp. J119]
MRSTDSDATADSASSSAESGVEQVARWLMSALGVFLVVSAGIGAWAIVSTGFSPTIGDEVSPLTVIGLLALLGVLVSSLAIWLIKRHFLATNADEADATTSDEDDEVADQSRERDEDIGGLETAERSGLDGDADPMERGDRDNPVLLGQDESSRETGRGNAESGQAGIQNSSDTDLTETEKSGGVGMDSQPSPSEARSGGDSSGN